MENCLNCPITGHCSNNNLNAVVLCIPGDVATSIQKLETQNQSLMTTIKELTVNFEAKMNELTEQNKSLSANFDAKINELTEQNKSQSANFDAKINELKNDYHILNWPLQMRTLTTKLASILKMKDESQRKEFIRETEQREPKVSLSLEDIKDIIEAAEKKDELVQYLSSIAHPNYNLSTLNKIPDEYTDGQDLEYIFPGETSKNTYTVKRKTINQIIGLAQQNENLKDRNNQKL